jgi:hypothetical protein
MLDVTNITMEAIPQSLADLAIENHEVKNQNQIFKIVLTSLLILIVGSGIYIVSNKKNNNESGE